MRLRRQNKRELTRDQYERSIWANYLYRIPRIYNDFSMTIYKKAAINYGENYILKFIFNLIFSFLLNPKYVIRKIIHQNLIKTFFDELLK